MKKDVEKTSNDTILVPILHNVHNMPMHIWYQRYEYFIDCIWDCICNCIANHGGLINDYKSMRYRLEVYLYKTSLNKLYKYHLLK